MHFYVHVKICLPSCLILLFSYILKQFLSGLCVCIGGPTDLYTWCFLCPHRELFVFRRSYKHDGQRLPGGHEVILDLCVVSSYTWHTKQQQLNLASKQQRTWAGCQSVLGVCKEWRLEGICLCGTVGSARVCVRECACVLACELVVEIDDQRVVPPVKGGKQMKEAKEADLRRTERGGHIHSHDLLNEQRHVLFCVFLFYFWKPCTKARLKRRVVVRKRPWIPWWTKRCRMQEKRRHQKVGRVLRHIVGEELRTQPALGQATHCTKAWVLLLKPRKKRRGA